LLFLQRYIWLLRIAEKGYVPYQTISHIAELSAAVMLMDVLIFRGR
jgi:hypothetical protein